MLYHFQLTFFVLIVSVYTLYSAAFDYNFFNFVKISNYYLDLAAKVFLSYCVIRVLSSIINSNFGYKVWAQCFMIGM